MNLRRLFKEVEEMLGQMLRKKEADIKWQKKTDAEEREKKQFF